MKIYTIGFTQKSAERFFGMLRDNGVGQVLDIRLRPYGQLAGFAKSADLRYFLRSLINCDYIHLPQLAPTDEILDGYHATRDWETYARQFETLLDQRGMPDDTIRDLLERAPGCLLCSESSPDRCHRRLVAGRMASLWPGCQVIHLV